MIVVMVVKEFTGFMIISVVLSLSYDSSLSRQTNQSVHNGQKRHSSGNNFCSQGNLSCYIT